MWAATAPWGILKIRFTSISIPPSPIDEIIAELDPGNYKAIVAGAKCVTSPVPRPPSNLAQAEEERQSALSKSKIVAQSDYDTAVAAYHQAQAAVLQKEASAPILAQVNLAYCTIYAPVDGVVVARNVDVGQTVAASLSAPTLFMIANDLTKMQIDALVSEADIGGVETNQPVNFTVDAFPSRIFQGIVLQIRNAAQTNQNVIDYDTVIGVDNSELKLRPGMTANVSIITAQRKSVLNIPNGALRFHPPEPGELKKATNTIVMADGGPGGGGGGGGQGRQGGGGNGQGRSGGGGGGGSGAKRPHAEPKPTRTVYVLAKGPDGKTDILKPVLIKIGINDGINTQLIDGLNEGDEVVIGQNLTGAAAVPGAPSNPFSGGGRRY